MIKAESVGRAEAPFEVIPRAPVEISSHVNSFFDCPMGKSQIVADGPYPEFVIMGADSVFGDIDRFSKTLPESSQTFQQSLWVIFPHHVVLFVFALDFSRGLNEGHWERIESDPGVVAHTEEIGFCEYGSGEFHKAPIENPRR